MDTSPTSHDSFPRLYATSQRFNSGKPRTFRVVDDGKYVLYCRARSESDPMLLLWVFDVEAETERLLVDPKQLGQKPATISAAEQQRRERNRESGAGIVSYQVSSRGQVCFVHDQNLHIAEVATGECSTVATANPVFDPRFSPDGASIAYVHNQDLRIVSPEHNSSDRLLLQHPDKEVSFGKADFIAAEEMGRSRGFWWSPDSRQILATKVNEGDVAEWWIAQPGTPHLPPRALRYPAAGTANSTTELALVQVDGTEPATTTSVRTFSLGDFEYLADVVWVRTNPLVVRQSRDQKLVNFDELVLDVDQLRPDDRHGAEQRHSSENHNVAWHNKHRIRDDIWVDLVAGSPAVDSAGLLTVETKFVTSAAGSNQGRGYKALCLNGEAITDHNLDVRSIVAIGDFGGQHRCAIVSVWTPPASQTLVKVDLETRETSLLSEPAGVSSGVFSGQTALVNYSSSTAPGSQTTINRITNHQLTPTHTIRSFHQVADFKLNVNFETVGDDIEVAVFLPTNHDGATKLPVLMDPYGGPHARRVSDSHDCHLVSQWFANHGYAVIVADGCGTPGRGVKSEQHVWGDLAKPVLDDQITALDAVASRLEYIDLSRVAIRGWSFGGYLAALAVLTRPDRFRCGLAGAPVTSWHLYDTHYTERYLGHPDTHPEHYERCDLLSFVKSMPASQPRSDLLLMHGLADDNVVAAHTLQLSGALLSVGYPHQVLPLAGVTHMTPQASIAENLLRLQLDFLDRSLSSKVDRQPKLTQT